MKNLEKKLTHEFIPPRSPDRNAYIEAFNSILETEVLKVQYFNNFEEVYISMVRFIEFYNNRRLHGSLKYLSPKMFIDGGEKTLNILLAFTAMRLEYNWLKIPVDSKALSNLKNVGSKNQIEDVLENLIH